MLDTLISIAEALFPARLKQWLKRLLLSSSWLELNFSASKGAGKNNAHYFVHTGEQEQSGKSHLQLWMPVFLSYERTHNINCAVIVRNKSLFKWACNAYPEAAIYYCRFQTGIEKVVRENPSAQLCLHPSTTQRMMHMVAIEELTHAWIGHGDSDKQSSVRKVMRMCDEVWVAGQAHIDRFANAPGNYSSLYLRKVGRPQIKELLKTPTSELSSKKLCYLPTWEGASEATGYSSLPVLAKELNKLTTFSELIIDCKLHPQTGSRILDFLTYEKIITESSSQTLQLLAKDKPLIDILPNYSAFICDSSAVVSDCLATQKPLFVYQPQDEKVVLASSNMSYADYCYCFSSVEELRNLIQQVLVEGDDYLADKRKQAMHYILAVDETLNDAFVQAIIEISSNRKDQK